MLLTMQILTIILVAIAMCPAIAHAMEYPGKMRLNRDAYLTVQHIYYPGFTFAGGGAEAVGTIASIVLLFLTPRGTPAFGLTCAAAFGMVGMQIVFWAYTQPVNRFWMRNQPLSNLGHDFFAAGPQGDGNSAADWRALRDRWELSHIVRAGLAFVGFLALLATIALNH